MKKEDLSKIEELEKTRKKNFLAFSLIADYLNEFPTLVNERLMKEIGSDMGINEERVFAIFLSNALSDDEGVIRILEREYLKKSVKKLNATEYKSDPYYKNIKIPTKKLKNWSLGYQTYQKYEGFIYKDILVEDNYTEIPQIGFFNEEFSFPTVFENGVEWMAIKPNEIETMKHHIEKMEGDVAVFGLGMGYFAYMVSQKQEVNSITIVERDENVIQLFEENILPQFPNKDKITIEKCDAFDFVENKQNSKKYRHAFVDLWHDAGDGLPLYSKMKGLESKMEGTEFSYWIEDTLITYARWQIFIDLYDKIKNGTLEITYEDVEKAISKDGIVKILTKMK
ncbi:MAG: hypothetical protein IJA82_04030 [Clostridia bacterium]|nr:hypothetical protein [Clostridia bacterium]